MQGMLRICWISRDVLPQKEDGDEAGCVLAWHHYNGCVVASIYNVRNNPMYEFWYWMPDGPNAEEEAKEEEPEGPGGPEASDG